jgi:hypothetical protein
MGRYAALVAGKARGNQTLQVVFLEDVIELMAAEVVISIEAEHVERAVWFGIEVNGP